MTPTDQQSLTAAVLTAVQTEVGNEPVTPESTFGELDIESLTFAEILMSLEDQFGASLGLEEEFARDAGATVQQLVDAVAARLQDGR